MVVAVQMIPINVVNRSFSNVVKFITAKMLLRYSLFFIISLIFSAKVDGQKTTFSLELIAETKDKSLLSQVVDLDMTTDSQGNIRLYIADVFTPSVLIMEKNGDNFKDIDRLGSEGQGPGEFIELSSVQYMPDGNLMVYDRSLARVTFFNSGTQQVEHVNNINAKQTAHFPMEFYAAGTDEPVFYSRAEKFFSDKDNPFEQRNTSLQRYNAEGKLITDSVLVKPSDDAFIFRSGGNMSVNPQPVWGNKSIFRFRDDYIYYTWTGYPEIEVYNREGLHIQTIPLQLTRLRITDDDRQRALDLEATMMGQRKRVIRKLYFEVMPIDFWPWAHDFLVDDKERLWLALPNHLKDKNRVWRAHSAEGNFIGQVHLPADFTVHQIKENYIVGELFDFNDFSSTVQLYQLREN